MGCRGGLSGELSLRKGLRRTEKVITEESDGLRVGLGMLHLNHPGNTENICTAGLIRPKVYAAGVLTLQITF